MKRASRAYSLLIIGGLLAGLSCGKAFAENPDVEALLHKWEPGYQAPLVVSADGKWIAVTMHGLVHKGAPKEAELPRESGIYQVAEEDCAGDDIWIVERATGKVTRPFENFAGSFMPAWSPSGDMLALAVQDSPTRYPRIATWTPGDAAPHVFADARFHPAGFTAPTWTPDGKSLLFPIMRPVPLRDTLVTGTITPATQVKVEETNSYRETLCLLDIARGSQRVFIGFGPFEYDRSWGFRLAPDGTKAAFLAQAPEVEQGVQVNWKRLTTVDLVSGKSQVIGDAQKEGWALGFSWSPDGKRIAWHASPGEDTPTEALYLAVLDETPKLQTLAWPKEKWGAQLHNVEGIPQAPPVWDADGSGFWITGRNELHHFSRDGAALADMPLPNAKGGAEWFENNTFTFAPVRTQAVPASGELYIQRQKEIDKIELKATPPKSTTIAVSTGPEHAVDWVTSTVFSLGGSARKGWDLMQTSLADGKSSRLATLAPAEPEIAHGPIRTLSWKLADGTACQGTLLLPDGWKDGDKPPVVMDVYAADVKQGNKNATQLNEACLIVNPFLLAAHGYAVFKPDMPENAEQPASSLALSAEAAADALKADGSVDADRIAIVGQSFGGYTTLCALTGSTRFKAGIVANGLYDLLRADSDGTDDAEWAEGGQALMKSTVWETPQRYLDNSPLYSLKKLQVPLLVVQGGADGLSKEHGQALINSLQRLGKPASYIIGPDMDHVPISWSVEMQRELIPRVLDFLDQNLKTPATKHDK